VVWFTQRIFLQTPDGKQQRQALFFRERRLELPLVQLDQVVKTTRRRMQPNQGFERRLEAGTKRQRLFVVLDGVRFTVQTRLADVCHAQMQVCAVFWIGAELRFRVQHLRKLTPLPALFT
jgi:hypothetical protein